MNQRSNSITLITGAETSQFPLDILISYGNIEESCRISKVPSTSTTLMLIIADILAITAAEKLGFDDRWNCATLVEVLGKIMLNYPNNSFSHL